MCTSIVGRCIRASEHQHLAVGIFNAKTVEFCTQSLNGQRLDSATEIYLLTSSDRERHRCWPFRSSNDVTHGLGLSNHSMVVQTPIKGHKILGSFPRSKRWSIEEKGRSASVGKPSFAAEGFIP